MTYDRIILFIVAAAFILCVAVIVPAQEKRKRASKEAAKIAAMFGSKAPTLFIFEDRKNGNITRAVFALVSDGRDEYSSEVVYDIYDLFGHGKNGEIKDRAYSEANKYVHDILSLLPYRVPSCITYDSWADFCRKRYKKRTGEDMPE